MQHNTNFSPVKDSYCLDTPTLKRVQSKGTHLGVRPSPPIVPTIPSSSSPLLFSDDGLMQMSERGGTKKSGGKIEGRGLPTHFDLGRPQFQLQPTSELLRGDCSDAVFGVSQFLAVRFVRPTPTQRLFHSQMCRSFQS